MRASSSARDRRTGWRRVRRRVAKARADHVDGAGGGELAAHRATRQWTDSVPSASHVDADERRHDRADSGRHEDERSAEGRARDAVDVAVAAR
jgi:hypothetical protein